MIILQLLHLAKLRFNDKKNTIMARYIAAFTFFHYLHVAIAAANSSNDSNITSDSFFYGQSPPVYPSPPTLGTGDWVSAVQKAQSLVSQMTEEEKLNITCGATVTNGCSGYIVAIPRLGFEGMCLQDGIPIFLIR
jgi:hypothetical protein